MPLHPQSEGLLAAMREQGAVPFSQLSVPQAREAAEALRGLQLPSEPVAAVHDVLADGAAGRLPVRIFVPDAPGPLPLIVYFHGGGWVLGSVDLVDRPCRALANACKSVVAVVGYRRAPETRFPGAVEDAYAATCWLSEHADEYGADPGRVVVAGDSAGGNLAAATALIARDRNGPDIAAQVLVYPVTSAAAGDEFESYTLFGEGYTLTSADMAWFWDHYASEEDRSSPYASPLLADDVAGLPPAVVVVAEFDPLHDEGVAYAERLRAAGGRVSLRRFEGLMHGFFWMSGAFDDFAVLIDHISDELDGVWSSHLRSGASTPVDAGADSE